MDPTRWKDADHSFLGHVSMSTIKHSVTEFSQPILQTGSIVTGGLQSLLSIESMDQGIQIHKSIQSRRAKELSNYRSEVAVSHKFPLDETLQLEVTGRIDGCWTDAAEDLVIEEIKSTYKTKQLLSDLHPESEHPYILQIKTYGWIKWIQTGVTPKLQLLIVGISSTKEQILEVPFDPQAMNDWISRKLAWYKDTWYRQQAFIDSRKEISRRLRFPFKSKRIGQEQLITAVEETCKTGGQLMIEAPTGMGKTAAVMVPAIKASLSKGEKLFHVTPKNSQLEEAEKVIRKLQKKSPELRGLIITAKAKICMQDTVRCDPEHCRFAKDHYDKVNSHQLIDTLLDQPIIKRSVLQEYSEKFEVCPYELGRQLMPWMDVIAGDYHYALSPQHNLVTTAKLPLVKDPGPTLTIDEGHNLADRSLEWYSVEIGTFDVTALSPEQHKLAKCIGKLNRWLLELVEVLLV